MPISCLEYQLQHPRMTDTVLTANAKRVLSQLELDRTSTAEDTKARVPLEQEYKDSWCLQNVKAHSSLVSRLQADTF